jgi:hypothetical protein
VITVCVPTLKRYDLLRRMVRSLEQSTVKPDCISIIDNGQDGQRLTEALAGIPFATDTFTPVHKLGVAASWNWFIKNVPEHRLITNDDITFAPDSLAKMLEPDADLIWAAGVGFSCFVIRDSCVKKLGYFDETISPGYGYYEDEDYLQRLDGRGTREPSAKALNVDSGVKHEHSATLKASSRQELLDHHRKFKIAQTNYINKWSLQESFK